MLSAAHMVTGLGLRDANLVEEIRTRIAAVAPGDPEQVARLAQTLAETVFSAAGLRAELTALSRGHVIHVPVGTDARDGTIAIHARVDGLTYARRDEKFEYENGADRQSNLITESGRRWRAGLGVQAQQGLSKFFRLFGAAGHQWDWVSGDSLSLGGRTFSRAKTAEPSAVFNGTLHLTVEYRRPYGPAARTSPLRGARPLEIPLEVAIPLRETLDASGAPFAPSAAGTHQPPEAVRRSLRLGGSHVLLDVHALAQQPVSALPPGRETAPPRATAPSHGEEGIEMAVLQPAEDSGAGVGGSGSTAVRPAPAGPETTSTTVAPSNDAGPATRRGRLLEGVLDKLSTEDRAKLGDEHFRALSDRLVAEVDFTRLHQELKSMMSGDPLVVRVPGTDLWAEVTATVREMRHVSTTKADSTEFNVGTGAQLTTVQQKVRSGLWHAQGGAGGGGEYAGMSLAGGGRRGTDVVRISGHTLETGLTTKTKETGVVFEGISDLQVVVKRGGKPFLGQVEQSVGFRTVIPQSEIGTAPPAGAANAGGHGPGFFRAEAPADLTLPDRDLAVGETVRRPLTTAWSAENGGLDSTVVVRDVVSVAELRANLEEQGAGFFKDLWPEIREEVMQLVSQPMVASRLTAMTRGEEFGLASFDRSKMSAALAALAKRGIGIAVTAEVRTMTHLRGSDGAELTRQNESSRFSSERRVASRHGVGQGQANVGPAGQGAGLVTPGGQERLRTGVRAGSSDKVYGNGKFAAPQEIFDSTVQLSVTLTRGTSTVSATAPVRAELSVDRRLTGEHQVEAERSASFTAPLETPAPVAPTAPRVPYAEMSASDVVHRLEGAGAVNTAVAAHLERFGKLPADVARIVAERLGPAALQAELSQLSRGGHVTVKVAGKAWEAEITVSGRLRGEATPVETIGKFESEAGSQNKIGHGVSHDQRDRSLFGVGGTGKASPVDITAGYVRRDDASTGFSLDSSGGTTSRGKATETADVLATDVIFDVRVTSRRLSVPGMPSHTEQLRAVEAHATVVRPVHEQLSDTGENHARPVRVPQRIEESHVLGSADYITNVFDPARRAPGGDTTRGFGESLLGRAATGERLFDGKTAAEWLNGRGRSGLRDKLLDVLTPNTLHEQLKVMMSGRKLVIGDGGVTIRIGASLDSLRNTGASKTTEFNTGAQVEHGYTAADGVTGGGGGTGHTVTATVAGSPGTYFLGGSLSGGTGAEHQEQRSSRTGAGNATKAKIPGSVFGGEATLHFIVERRSALGGTTYGYFTRKVGIEAFVDRAETRPALPVTQNNEGSAAGQEPGGPPRRPAPDPNTFSVEEIRRERDRLDREQPDRPRRTRGALDTADTAVRRPPAALWDSGLADSHVVRALGGAEGLRGMVAAGKSYFGKGDWSRIKAAVERIVDPVSLAGHLNTQVHPEAERPARPADGSPESAEGGGPAVPKSKVGLATYAIGPVALTGGAGVEVRLTIRDLEYQRTDTNAEMSPSGGAAAGAGDVGQRSFQAGGRFTAGPSWGKGGDFAGRLTGNVDLAYQSRGETSTASAGQVLANAKVPTTMARYEGHVEVEVTFVDGTKEPRTQKAVVPIMVDIPERETTPVTIPGDGYLVFHGDAPDGEVRPREADPRRLERIAEAAGWDTTRPADHEDLLRTARVGRLLYGDRFLRTGTEQEIQDGDGLSEGRITARAAAVARLVRMAGEGSGEHAVLDTVRTLMRGEQVDDAGRTGAVRTAVDALTTPGGERVLTAEQLDTLLSRPAAENTPAPEPAAVPDRNRIGLTEAALRADGRSGLPRQIRNLLATLGEEDPRIVLEVTGDPASPPTAEWVRRTRADLERMLRDELRSVPRAVDVVVRLSGNTTTGAVWGFRVAPPEPRNETEDSIFSALMGRG
ncbi:hypothetical protein [Kitasatospora sp. NPDC091207]|uniref:hypothetical protein n=1 Tax=Kitasatospora sp. NPDC091207 TaxID=3364083 RepID=UPI0037F821E9